MTNLVTPIPRKVLVFRTRDGRYAKVEILSYYQNAPSNPDGFVEEIDTFSKFSVLIIALI